MNKNFSLMFFVVALIGFASLPITSLAVVNSNSKPNLNKSITSSNYIEGMVIVKFKKSGIETMNITKVSDDYINKASQNMVLGSLTGADKQLASFAIEHKLAVKNKLNDLNMVLFYFDAKTRDINTVLAEIENDALVDYAQPNYLYKLQYPNTNDTKIRNTYALDNGGKFFYEPTNSWTTSKQGVDGDMNVEKAWALGNNSEGQGVVVGVLDTGLAYDHPEFTGNLWDGSNCEDADGKKVLGGCLNGASYYIDIWRDYIFSNNPKTANRDNMYFCRDDDLSTRSHGSHVAGIIAARKNNYEGTAGVAPQAKIAGLQSDLTSWGLINDINFAIHNNIKIINASIGGYGYDEGLYDVIESFGEAGGLFVAAAGNDGNDNDIDPLYPCSYCLDNILCVAASDWNDEATYFSNYGKSTVDVFAPGMNIYSVILKDLKDNGLGKAYDYMSGTSMASPNVAGVAALVWGHEPGLTAVEVKKIIIDTVDKPTGLKDKVVSNGRVNAESALKEAEKNIYSCTDTDGGDKTYVKGKVSFNGKNGGGSAEDYCMGGGNMDFDNFVLVENFCINNELYTKHYRCYYGCDDGACIDENACEWQTVGIPGFSDGKTAYESLVIKPGTNTPYLAYEDLANGNKTSVKYNNGSGWSNAGNDFYDPLGDNNTFQNLAFNQGKVSYTHKNDFVFWNQAKVISLDENTQKWSYLGNDQEISDYEVDDTSLAYGYLNNWPYITFEDWRDSGNYTWGITVKAYNGKNWISIGKENFADNPADYTNLAFKPGTDEPYVAFRDKLNGEKKVSVMTYDDKNGWTYVGKKGFAAGETRWRSLAFDFVKKQPYVAYIDLSECGKASVKYWDGSAWQNVGNLGFSDGAVEYISLAINPGNNKPYVAYQDIKNGNKVTVKMFNGDSWINVGSSAFSSGKAEYESLAFGKNNQPYVAFSDEFRGNKATVMTCVSK